MVSFIIEIYYSGVSITYLSILWLKTQQVCIMFIISRWGTWVHTYLFLSVCIFENVTVGCFCENSIFTGYNLNTIRIYEKKNYTAILLSL